VAASLGRAVAELDEPELEVRLLQAASVVGKYEDPKAFIMKGAETVEWRTRRIERTLEALAAARTEAEIEARLPRWRAALGDAAELTSTLAPMLPSWSAERVHDALGPVRDGGSMALARSWAGHGRWADAIAFAEGREPAYRAAALRAIADAPLSPDGWKKLVKAFEKCPKAGRERDQQTNWKQRRAEIRLRAGAVDEAISALGALPDCRTAGRGPGPLAIDIAEWLDAHDAWSAERALALTNALATSGIIAQDLPRPALDVLGRSVPHAAPPEPVLASLRARFRGRPDEAVVDAGVALGHAHAGAVGPSCVTLSRCLDRLERGDALLHFVLPHHLLEVARACLEGGGDDARALWRRAALLAVRLNPRDAVPSLKSAAASLQPAEVPMWIEVLGAPAMTEAIAEPMRDTLCAEIAMRVPQGEDVLAMLVEQAPDATTRMRRSAWAAVLLAHTKRPAEATTLFRAALSPA
jgi:hypothetical protein